MVFLTQTLMKYMPKWLPRGSVSHTDDKRFFRRMRLYMLTANFHGRKRTSYKLAINKWTKYVQIDARERKEKKYFFRDLYSQRLAAALQEHRFPYKYFLGILPQMSIELDRKVLAHMSIWEPRTFAALIDLCKTKVLENPVGQVDSELKKPDGVISRNML